MSFFSLNIKKIKHLLLDIELEIKAEDNIQPMQTLVLKLDIKSLPKGTEVSSSNPVIVKIREGLMSEVNFKIKYVD